MSEMKERHALEERLAAGEEPSTPSALVEWLAAYAVEDVPARREVAGPRLRAAVERFGGWVEEAVVARPLEPAADWREEVAWILDFETVSLAASAHDVLTGPGGEAVQQALEVCVTEFALVFEERVWANPLVARASREGSLPNVPPWSRIRSGVATGKLRPEGPVEARVLAGWLQGHLHAEDAAALQQWVGQPGPWQEAYRARLAKRMRCAQVPRSDARRSISVAMAASELAWAAVVQDVPLPHLGFQARREGRLHVDGTWWRVVGAERPEDATEQRLPYGTSRLVWADRVLGEIVTELVELPAEPLALAEDARASMVRLAEGLPHPRARAVARAVAEDLRAGALAGGLQAAARAFEDADLDDEVPVRWAACALSTQLVLERLGHRLADPELDVAMMAAEEALEPYAAGLLLLPDDTYRDAVAGYDVDPQAWWGMRERLDERVPEAVVTVALEQLAQEPASARPVVSLRGYRAAVERAPAGERLDTYEVRAAAAAREPGTVDLLVTVDEGGVPVGRVLRVSVRRGTGEAFDASAWFAPVARDAIREAYLAAGAVCPHGVPPVLLEDHRVVVHDAAEVTIIDGSSLGLAFVLAFASAWLDVPVPAGLVATGRVIRHGRVAGVDHVLAKAAALDSSAQLLVAAEQARELEGAAVQLRPVATVVEALRAARLDLPGSNLAGVWPDRQRRFAALRELIAAIEAQDVAHFSAWDDPWRFAGDRVALLVEGLPSAEDEVVGRARVCGALAYVHAGELERATALLAGVDPQDEDRSTAVMHGIVALGAAIDRHEDARAEALRAALERDLDALTPRERRLVAGQAWGTIGRSFLHAGAPTAAITWLERAVRHHAEARPQELGRSRVHLASALRAAGRLDEAAQELAQAAIDLERETRPWSVPYAQQCEAYLRYERARVAVARGDADAALGDALAAYAAVRHQGFWPALGILRVLAWAHRLRGEVGEAERYLLRMTQLQAPPEHRGLHDRLVEEAAGLPRTDGETY